MGTAVGFSVSVITVYAAARLCDGNGSRRRRPLFFAVTAVEVVLLLLFGRGGFLDPGPIGLSYGVLQSLSYFYDVAAGKYPAERNFLKVAWFILYPPQLVMGPIGRYDALSKTLFSPTLSFRSLSFGLQRMLYGAFKKLVVADRMAPAVLVLARGVFGTGAEDALPFALSGRGASGFFWAVPAVMLCYGIQLYADFTGGIDLVIGFSEIFGIRLSENFDLPYFATSLKDFWRRWHMTMAGWFREYVFYPLGTCGGMRRLKRSVTKRFGKEAGRKLPLYLTSLTVWILTGLWHGLYLHTLLWGIANFAVLMISYERESLAKRLRGSVAGQPAEQLLRGRHPFTEGRGYEWFAILRTWLVVAALRMFDVYGMAAGRTAGSGVFGGDLSQGNAAGFPDRADAVVLLFGTVLMFLAGLWKKNHPGRSLRERIAALPGVLPVVLWFFLFVTVLVFGVYGPDFVPARFIYQ